MIELRKLVQCFLVLALAGCSDSPRASGGPDVQIDTIGDTVIVHTRRGQEWPGTATLEPGVSIGELDGDLTYIFGRIRAIALDRTGNIYVLDEQSKDIRSFDSEGRHIRTYGRAGQGPGELTAPDALAVSPSGRVLVRDPRSGRVQVFESTGEAADEWPLLNPNFGTGDPLWVDDAERAYIVTKPRNADVMSSPTVVISVSGNGTVLDTIPIPTSSYVPVSLEAVSVTEFGSSRYSTFVPFTPQAAWAVHPNGSLVLAISDRYRIDLISESGTVLRIGRDYDPVPVAAGEREFHEDQVTTGLRHTDPDWRWTGPPIPSEKAPFQDVLLGIDGRLWVWLLTPGEESANPGYDPDNPQNAPQTTWSEAVSFDVFESDGRYLGRVDAPREFTMFPTPVFDTDGAWAVTYDELGVPRVTRFNLRISDAS